MHIIQSSNQKQHHARTESLVHASMSSWVEIDIHALEHNIAQYKSIAPNALFAPVIKSNAYGHGIQLIASVLDTNPYVNFLCTASLSEALHLTSIGIKKPLIVLSIIDEDIAKAVRHNIALIVYDIETAITINEAGKACNKKVMVHIKVDTGLSRLGVLAQEVVALVKQISMLSHVIIQGIFTHFAASERLDQTFTDNQIAQFNFVIKKIESLGIDIPLKHTSCSAAITANTASHFTMTRAGIGIYGIWPSVANKELTTYQYPLFSLKPVMTWKTKILHIKEVPAGTSVGYDLTYKTNKTIRVATLPIGYWDGYDRRLSNNALVMINNQHAPVIGNVAMNLMTVDITHIKARAGDTVTLLGDHDGISAHDLARRCGTIAYQVVTTINPLLPRIRAN